MNTQVVTLSTSLRFGTKCSINLFFPYYNNPFLRFHLEGRCALSDAAAVVAVAVARGNLDRDGHGFC